MCLDNISKNFTIDLINLGKCVGSYNTFNDLPNKVFVPNKPEDLNINVFNIIIVINESKLLTKHISYKCEFKFDGKKCNPNQM